jgi:hypothetical protein
MSYMCGIGERAARYLGVKPGDSRIWCDICGARVEFPSIPPDWFLDGKHKPGWKMRRLTSGRRIDVCSACKGTQLARTVMTMEDSCAESWLKTFSFKEVE